MDLAADQRIGAPPTAAAPFRLTPDRKFLFHSRGHIAAHADLRGAIAAGKRIIALVGEPGTGKTTLLTALVAEPGKADRAIVYCPYPALSLAALLQDFLGASEPPADPAPDAAAIADRLAAAHRGRHLVLVIDDAARSPPRLLIDLCRLADSLAASSCSLQIVLAANAAFHLELDRQLAAADMATSTRIELPSLQIDEIDAYVRHRLRVAGLVEDLFSGAAIDEIARHSLGIARAVNQICSRSLMLSEWRRERPISSRLIVEAIEDCPIDALVALRTPDIALAAPIAAPDSGMSLERPALETAPANPATPGAPAPAGSEPKADIEIDLPRPPSLTASDKAEDEPRPMVPSSEQAVAMVLPLGKGPFRSASWRLREIARDRRRTLDSEASATGDTGARPRFSGFTARRRVVEPPKSAGNPPPVEKARRRAWPAVFAGLVIVAIGFGGALALQPTLITPIVRAMPDSLRADIDRLWSRIGTAANELLEFIQPAYRYEPPPRS